MSKIRIKGERGVAVIGNEVIIPVIGNLGDVLKEITNQLTSISGDLQTLKRDLDIRLDEIERRIDTNEDILDRRNEWDDERLLPIETTVSKLSKYISIFSTTYNLIDASENTINYPDTDFSPYQTIIESNGLDSSGFLAGNDNYENLYPVDLEDFESYMQLNDLSNDLSNN